MVAPGTEYGGITIIRLSAPLWRRVCEGARQEGLATGQVLSILLKAALLLRGRGWQEPFRTPHRATSRALKGFLSREWPTTEERERRWPRIGE